MRRPGIRTAVRGAARRLSAAARGGPLILLYHRVADAGRDPQRLCVTPRHFAEHLDALVQSEQVVALRDIVRALREGRVPRTGIAITFDDGYEDNLEVAEPALRRLGVPAPVFVVAGDEGEPQPFWWDELEWLLLNGSSASARLTVRHGGELTTWRLEGLAAGEPERRLDSWVLGQTPATGRQAAYAELCAMCRSAAYPERDAILGQVRAQVGRRASRGDVAARLTETQLRRLLVHGCVDVGAHTQHHVRLKGLSAAEQLCEMVSGKVWLEEVLGRTVALFSYPYGAPGDMDAVSRRCTVEAGFLASCANAPGLVGNRTDPTALPRLLVRDCSAEELLGRIHRLRRTGA